MKKKNKKRMQVLQRNAILKETRISQNIFREPQLMLKEMAVSKIPLAPMNCLNTKAVEEMAKAPMAQSIMQRTMLKKQATRTQSCRTPTL